VGDRFRVVLSDGCEFDEHRPPGMARPVDGELRVCGHPEHYPAQFPARYTDLAAATAGLAAALTGTREGWLRWWAAASDADRTHVGAAMHALHDQGTGQGGAGCCGTLGAWHRPWCYLTPHEHEAARDGT
jgi:hypothetical protein